MPSTPRSVMQTTLETLVRHPESVAPALDAPTKLSGGHGACVAT